MQRSYNGVRKFKLILVSLTENQTTGVSIDSWRCSDDQTIKLCESHRGRNTYSSTGSVASINQNTTQPQDTLCFDQRARLSPSPNWKKNSLYRSNIIAMTFLFSQSAQKHTAEGEKFMDVLWMSLNGIVEINWKFPLNGNRRATLTRKVK